MSSAIFNRIDIVGAVRLTLILLVFPIALSLLFFFLPNSNPGFWGYEHKAWTDVRTSLVSAYFIILISYIPGGIKQGGFAEIRLNITTLVLFVLIIATDPYFLDIMADNENQAPTDTIRLIYANLIPIIYISGFTTISILTASRKKSYLQETGAQ